jgi:acyl-CoA synthetase (AMP-forming)/AMP-acid ligase II
MLQILLSQPLEDYELGSLQYVSSGGAPLAAEVAEQFVRRVPSAKIRQGYGLTETAALISTNPVGREKAGSVGLPVPGTEVRICDDAGSELPPNEVGEICARSPGVMEGYWHSPEATSEALRDGWLHTGDLGYLDEDGYLFIVDRKKDMIITGGFNVYAIEVEAALSEHPAVLMSAVVGVPHPEWGEAVHAEVILRADMTASPDELIDHAKRKIGNYKAPKTVKFVDELPLSSVGKVLRRHVRQPYWEGRGRMVN